uniref:Uncharacterized protein n=1 Tax=Anguilla anguilla TaxID=7936 RepID=A0A0E9RH86_ANGAN
MNLIYMQLNIYAECVNRNTHRHIKLLCP